MSLTNAQGFAKNTIYAAGNLNAWNPANSAYQFDANGNLELQLKKGTVVSFKLTRGSWDKVECKADGSDISNRSFIASADTFISLTVAGWKDAFASKPKPHTASPNVMRFDSAFVMPQLQRTRTIRIYLPPDYNTSTKSYPVLYMHDGQNCFDEFTAGYGEWHADEALDHYFDSCKRSMIVVAIDHGGAKRLTEYNPYNNPRFGPGEGKAYVDFLVKTLKPAIDKQYRTQKNKTATHIAGSSMGGLISLWAVMTYPKVFGSAGVFSPALWTAPPIQIDAPIQLKKYKGMLFFYAGGAESDLMVPQMDAIIQSIKKVSKAKVNRLLDATATHNEQAWSLYFPQYLRFIL